VTPLPLYLFRDAIRLAALDALIEESQETDQDQFKQLERTHGWEKQNGQWKKEGQLAIISNLVKTHILKKHYDHPTAGHPGTASTYFSVRTQYWWPKMKEWIQ
jgi:hypothetical protein